MELLEREAEISAIDASLSCCRQGSGRILLIEGFAATGRSALLRVAVAKARQAEFTLLTASGSRSARDIPLGVVRQLLEGMPHTADPRARSLSQRIKQLQTTAAAGVSDDGAGLLADFIDLMMELAERASMLIAVDDLHEVDGPSLQYLLHLAPRVQFKPAVLVLSQLSTVVPENQFFQTELKRQPHCQIVRIRPLSQSGVARLLAARLPSADALRLAPGFYELSGGNPLLVRALLEDRPVAADPLGETTGAAGGCEVGEEYRQAVIACLQRGEPLAAAVAHALAVLDESQSPYLASELLQMEEDLLGRLKFVLTQSGVLSANGFRHPAAQSAVAGLLSREDAAELHHRIAGLLYANGEAPAKIAGHLVAAGRADAPWAIGVLREAAGQALQHDDTELAKKYLEFASLCSTDKEQRKAITLALARVDWRRDPASALQYLTELTEALQEDLLDLDQALHVVRVLIRHGLLGEVGAVLERIARLVSDECDPTVLDNYLAFRAWLSSTYPALAHQMPAASSGTASELWGPTFSATTSLATASTLLDAVLSGASSNDAIDEVQQALRPLQLNDATLEPLGTALTALVYVDRVEEAGYWCADLLAEAAKRGVPAWEAVLASVMAEVSLRQGALPRAEKFARSALSLLSARSWGLAIGSPKASLLSAVLSRGDFRTANVIVNEPVPEAMHDTRAGLQYRQAVGQFFLETRRPHAALREFTGCGAQMREWNMDHPLFIAWRSGAAQALIDLGRMDEARELLEEQLALLKPEHRRVRGQTLRILGETGPRADREELLTLAVDHLEGASDDLELAKAVSALSRACADAGYRDRAEALKGHALRLARTCGAQPLVDLLVSPQSAASDRGGQARCTAPAQDAVGVDDLSEAERRVAALVVEGQSNQEVSDRLFVTVSTVEQHLTSIYRKLKVRGRGQLRAIYRDALTFERQTGRFRLGTRSMRLAPSCDVAAP
ncbi:LuxR C-terminal-related transcriptional regulator [Streptomyces goshikiensis]|uniref:helix-turn-helix transcriptional regulator n=1 Tax=Streptomyces goshikiensis TaxID=1942 RepID=UPI003654535D